MDPSGRTHPLGKYGVVGAPNPHDGTQRLVGAVGGGMVAGTVPATVTGTVVGTVVGAAPGVVPALDADADAMPEMEAMPPRRRHSG